ncbi:MAG TPA: FMN-binding protein [Feifaniaceae bacterium]|nr:FMN-binding protein [Feifaniaceae bacterium]
MKATKKWPLIAAGIVLLIALAGVLFYLDRVDQYQKHVAGMTIENIDFSTIPDGTYEGAADETFIRVKVRVTVRGGAVTDIALIEHENGRGKPAEAVIGEIIEQQTLAVDTVSGATNSSVMIKKAVENALRPANA